MALYIYAKLYEPLKLGRDMADDLYEELLSLQERLSGGNLGETPKPEPEDDDDDPVEEMQDVVDLVEGLGKFLANTYSVYHIAHGFHWNVKGPDFAQYHELFSGIYQDLIESVDPIAENILKLGYDSPFKMSELMIMMTIPEPKSASDNEKEDTPAYMTFDLLVIISALEKDAKELFELANDADEQGVANFVAERIDSLQKTMWQLRASLGVQKPALIKTQKPGIMLRSVRITN